MKIRPNKNPKQTSVVVEFDEFFFYTTSSDALAGDINQLAESFSARRLSYNMWEFVSREVADKFVFMYNLADYENKRKANRSKT
jgi:hypothetical protein